MEQHNRIKNIACFLTDYSTALLACGASSVRIEKNVARIAETYDVKAELSILTNHIILTVWDNQSDHSYSNVGKTKNSTISFYINTELSRLSWRIHDNYLELEKACKEYDRIINHPKINRWLVLLGGGYSKKCAPLSFVHATLMSKISFTRNARNTRRISISRCIRSF